MMEPKKKVVNKIVTLFNWTDEDFSHVVGGEQVLEFPAGEVTPIYVGDFKTNEGVRDMLAYHLAIRECNKEDYVPPSKEDRYLQDLIARAKSAPVRETIAAPAKPAINLPTEDDNGFEEE